MDQHTSRSEPADVDPRDARMRRRLLTEAPVGEWETLPGTPTAPMWERIRFAPDGTGETRGDGVFGGEIVGHFRWS